MFPLTRATHFGIPVFWAKAIYVPSLLVVTHSAPFSLLLGIPPCCLGTPILGTSFDPQPFAEMTSLYFPLEFNVDPGLTNPGLLIWGKPRFINMGVSPGLSGDLYHFWRGHPHI